MLTHARTCKDTHTHRFTTPRAQDTSEQSGLGTLTVAQPHDTTCNRVRVGSLEDAIADVGSIHERANADSLKPTRQADSDLVGR